VELATAAGEPSGLWLECRVLVTPTGRSVHVLTPRPKLPDRFVPCVQALIGRLVTHDFAGLVAAGSAGRWSAQELQELLATYEQTRDYGAFIEPAADAVRAAHVADTPHAIHPDPYQAGRWRVELAMWTQEGTPSDLTLFVDVESQANGVALRIDDLYVL
jgi:hypothetical protein